MVMVVMMMVVMMMVVVIARLAEVQLGNPRAGLLRLTGSVGLQRFNRVRDRVEEIGIRERLR
jgi:hypothetical protein